MTILRTTAAGWLGTLILRDPHRHAVRAHRSLPSGLTCGAQFGSPDAPLVVPNPAISWANYGIYTCDHPIQWYEATTADAGQMLYFTLTVPEIERFREVRMSAAIVGPGLTPAEAVSGNVPAAVLDHAKVNGLGIAVFDSPADQSTCSHLTSEIMFGASTVKDERCHFYESFGGSNLWVVLDEELAAPEAGTYQIAVYETNGMTAKASFACCDWPEDFITSFAIPETECDVCGAHPAKNPAWYSLFFEHKTMKDYGGYPPFQQCESAEPVALPEGDACPPAVDTTATAEVSESCTPHCGRDGVCHSHNILGDCTWTVDWVLTPKLGDADVTKIVMFKGDTLTFRHSMDDGLAHNLFRLLDGAALETCVFDGSTELANVEDLAIGHDITFDEAGEYHFTCGIGCVGAMEMTMGGTATDAVVAEARQGGFCHCDVGQKLAIEVKDAAEGMRCHSHRSDHGHDHGRRAAAACAEGSAAVFVVGDADYGAGAGECAELCAPAIALQFMAGVAEGDCATQGYEDRVGVKTVMPPGSPMEQEVTIYSVSAAAACAEGSAAAFVVGDADYGAGAGECAELCAPAIALQFMAGVAEGDCATQGYEDRVGMKTVMPPGSPMEQEVTIYSVGSSSHCHCHSYEEITCPGDDVDDTLYDEHIEEITTFCQGVLDGTEDDCPYLCYQPMEVLHLHYLECPSREVHETYAAVDAQGLCHGGGTDVPEGTKTEEMCPVVEVGQAEADGHGHDHDDKNGHGHGDKDDHYHGHDHGHSQDHSHGSMDTEPVAEETVANGSVTGDENGAPCAMYGSVFMAGLLLIVAMLMS